ncbi:MAG: tetratricopeptide repeat protein [Eubacteriales bacterium]|nr:tetratricopeptide repeat protein [Eubacteriales bacterium]
MSEELKKEDYVEPSCYCDTSMWQKEPPVKKIDSGRVIGKLDEYLYQNDYAKAEKHLDFWMGEAKLGNDKRGQLEIHNELMGLKRKLGKGDEARANAVAALNLVNELELDGTITSATVYINAGTVLKAFGEADKGLPYFEKAKVIYEKLLKDNDGRLGGLYNNMALTLTDLKRYEDALSYYEKAIEVMKRVENGEGDTAISYLNMANCLEAKLGLEDALTGIEECIETAWSLLNSDKLAKDGYYAFVAEKCAPTFEYYGYIGYAEELKAASDGIYAAEREKG